MAAYRRATERRVERGLAAGIIVVVALIILVVMMDMRRRDAEKRLTELSMQVQQQQGGNLREGVIHSGLLGCQARRRRAAAATSPRPASSSAPTSALRTSPRPPNTPKAAPPPPSPHLLGLGRRFFQIAQRNVPLERLGRERSAGRRARHRGRREGAHRLADLSGAAILPYFRQQLVVEDKISATTGGDYSGWGLDGGAVSLYAVAAGSNGLDKIEASVDGVLDDIRAHGVTEIELARAKKSLLADYIYESDNQASLARRYGWGVAVGR